MKGFLSFIIMMICAFDLLSQSIGIGTITPDSSASLEIESTTKGLLIPRMTSAERITIASPAAGLLVFDLDKSTIYIYDGIQWLPMLFSTIETDLPIVPIDAPSDQSEDDYFGYSIDIDGDYAVIGAPKDDVSAAEDRGSAYFFKRVNGVWVEEDKVVSTLGGSFDDFGFDVAISGVYAVIGAYQHDIGGIDKGSAFVFKRYGTSWTQIARLTDAGGAGGDHFGYSVDIDGDYIIVGAENAGSTGQAYVFYKNGEWTTGQSYQELLTSPAGVNAFNFGWSVCIEGDEVIVGDPYETVAGDAFRGAVSIYERQDTNWNFIARLIASDGEADDKFGYSVSLDGDYAAIGAPYDMIGTNMWQGSTYVFYRDTGWANLQAYQAKLLLPDGSAQNIFGSDVKISGDYIVAGAQWKDLGGKINTGQAAIFKRSGTTWDIYRTLEDQQLQDFSSFGAGLSIDGFNILVGAPGKNDYKGEVFRLNIE